METIQELSAGFAGLRVIFNDTSIHFLRTDLAIAMTMAAIAAHAPTGSEKRRRNTRNARRAFNEVRRLREKVIATAAENKDLDEKLDQLQMVLAALGEQF